MIVVMQQHAGEGATARVVRRIEAANHGAYVFHGEERNVIAVLGTRPGAPVDDDDALRDALSALPGVERVDRTNRPFKLASREVRPGRSVVPLGTGRDAGQRPMLGADLLIVAGSATPRPAQELIALGRVARDAGANAFWVGRGDSGELRRDLVRALDALRDDVSLPVIVDVWEPDEVERLSRHADALQIPAQQMQNFPLVDLVGRGDRPVVVTRGPSARIEEWLMAAERALRGGNMQLALCEQGIRTYEPMVQATLDFSAIAIVRRLSHLPIVSSPSLAAGHHELVPELALGAVAAGADGVVLDVRPPDEAVGGGPALPVDTLSGLVTRLEATRRALDAVAHDAAPALT